MKGMTLNRLKIDFKPHYFASQRGARVLLGGGAFILLSALLMGCSGSGGTKGTDLQGDGRISEVFDTGSGANKVVRGITPSSDGRLLYVYGDFDQFNDATHRGLVRLKEDGSVDDTFDIGEGFEEFSTSLGLVHKVIFDPSDSDRLYVAGGFGSVSGDNNLTNGIIRLNTSGSIDPTFDTDDPCNASDEGNGVETGFIAYDMTADTNDDSSIYVVGNFRSYQGSGIRRMVRVLVNGQPDGFPGCSGNRPVFEIKDKFKRTDNHPRRVLVRSNGKILLAGGFRFFGNNATDVDPSNTDKFVGSFFQLTKDGDRDPDFNIVPPGATAQDDISFGKKALNADMIFDMAFADDESGDVFVAGDFNRYKGETGYHNIIRIDPTGEAVNTFNTEQIDGHIYAVLPMGDHVYVGGNFTLIGNTPRNRIARFHLDGRLDESFNPGSGFDAPVRQIVRVKNSTYIYAVGNFATYRGESVGGIARINANGVRD